MQHVGSGTSQATRWSLATSGLLACGLAVAFWLQPSAASDEPGIPGNRSRVGPARTSAGAKARPWLARPVIPVWQDDLAEAVRGFPLEQRDDPAFARALKRWADRSPSEVLIWLQGQPDRARWSHVADEAATEWTRRDPDAALKWIFDLAPGEEQNHLLARFVIGWAGADPMRTGDIALELLPLGSGRQQAIEGIVSDWAQTDPAAAANWALSHSSDVARGGAIDLVLYSWLSEAPAQVEAWIGSLANPADRDLVRFRMLGWAAENSPEKAAASVLSIADERLRGQAAANLIGRWARDDFDVALEWASRVASGHLREQLLAQLAVVAAETYDPWR